MTHTDLPEPHDTPEPDLGDPKWLCALYGCMWWLWTAVDEARRLAGWQHVMVRPPSRHKPPQPPTWAPVTIDPVGHTEPTLFA